MGQLNRKYIQTPKQFVESGIRYDEIAEANRKAQNIINLKAILGTGIDKPLTRSEVNKFASMEDHFGEIY